MTFKRVLIDVDTQQDFLAKGGALPVSNRDRAIGQLIRVMAWVRRQQVPVISSMDTHTPNTTFTAAPLHCLDGSRGQRKMGFTLMRQRRMVETDATLSIPLDLLAEHRQLIFRKRSNDFFSNPKADRLLTQMDAEEIIICGVGIEDCIRRLVMGLLARHKRVTLVPEACGRWNPVDADLAARLMEARGARIRTVDELVALNGSDHAHARRNGSGNGQASANGHRAK